MDLPLMNTRAALALAEEHETERHRLYALLHRFAYEAFTTGDVQTEDNIRGILCHVTFATFSYACWIRRVLGRLDIEVEKAQKAEFLGRVRSCGSAAAFTEASDWATRHFYEALSDVPAADMGREFTTNWGQTMAVETMMEHALVHLMRHRRQLEIHLGLRPPGVVREE